MGPAPSAGLWARVSPQPGFRSLSARTWPSSRGAGPRLTLCVTHCDEPQGCVALVAAALLLFGAVLLLFREFAEAPGELLVTRRFGPVGVLLLLVLIDGHAVEELLL